MQQRLCIRTLQLLSHCSDVARAECWAGSKTNARKTNPKTSLRVHRQPLARQPALKSAQSSHESEHNMLIQTVTVGSDSDSSLNVSKAANLYKIVCRRKSICRCLSAKVAEAGNASRMWTGGDWIGGQQKQRGQFSLCFPLLTSGDFTTSFCVMNPAKAFSHRQ